MNKGKLLGESIDSMGRYYDCFYKDETLTIVFKAGDLKGVSQSCSISDIKEDETNEVFSPYIEFYKQILENEK